MKEKVNTSSRKSILTLKRSVILLLIINLILPAGMVVHENSKPYAVYADGTKTTVAYTINAGSDKTVFVKDEKTAKNVAKEVVESYVPEDGDVKKITVNKKITVGRANIEESDTGKPVLNEKQAVEQIIEKNDTENPYFAMTVESETEGVQEIKHETIEQETYKLFEGSRETVKKGRDGSKIVKENNTSINGDLVEVEEEDVEVLQEPTDEVVEVGTRDRDDLVVVEKGQAYYGDLIKDADGEDIAEYAQSFVGNPYVWGGTSLTEGCDCSGFIYAVYKDFGVSIPRVGAEDVGERVDFKDAKPGDVIYYGHHYAMYIGDGKIVHAYCKKYGICITSATAPGKILSVNRIVK